MGRALATLISHCPGGLEGCHVRRGLAMTKDDKIAVELGAFARPHTFISLLQCPARYRYPSDAQQLLECQ